MKKEIPFVVLMLFVMPFCNAQIITTIAGTGENGYFGDGGPAINAKMRDVNNIILDKKGNIYFTERSEIVRKISSSGVISTIAGTGNVSGYGGDGGPATIAFLDGPGGLALDDTGNLYVCDGVYAVRKIDTFGIINTIVGNHTCGYSGDGLPATAAQLGQTGGLTLDSLGNLYVVDRQYHNVRKITPTGIITTIAGTGIAGYNGDGITASTAQLNMPNDIVCDKNGNLFVTDGGNSRIRKINNAGIISTIAGDGTFGFSGDDGPATAAVINGAIAITMDDDGNIIFSEGWPRIRKINSVGIITTIAGTGSVGYSGDGSSPISAKFSGIYGLAFDKIANIYITDGQNYRVRMIRYNVGVSPLKVESNFCVYPNPVIGSTPFHIVRESDESMHVSIINTTGQTVKEFTTLLKEIELTLDFPDGLYYMQASTANAQYREMILVQH